MGAHVEERGMQAIRWGDKRSIGAVLAVALAIVTSLVLATSARAADCSPGDLSYNGACGPEFETPAWGDGDGWTDPSKYSTIQLADLTASGVDNLIARNDDGVEIWRFDTTVGQWRPAIGADGHPEVLTDFRSPSLSESGPNWTQAPYYSTIQTAVLTPGGAADIIARFPDGMRVYAYTPPAGKPHDIDGGTWSLISSKGPFSDADGYTDPSLYLTIHVIGAQNGRPAQMLAQTADGLVVYTWNGSGWTKVSPDPIGTHQSDPSNYLTLQWANLPSKDGVVHAVVEDLSGGLTAQYESGGKWLSLGVNPSPGPFALSEPPISADCNFNDDQCFGSSPSYYETLRLGDIVGDGNHAEALGRLSDGLRVWQLGSDGSTWSRLATLKALAGTSPPAGQWASIRLGNVLGAKGQQVLALDGNHLQTWSYDSQSNSWTQLAPSAPLDLGGDMWNNDASYYSTIRVGVVTPGGHEAVVARGPFGIRTWFYNLTANSGWTSYLPQDTSSYPQFSGGQAAAFQSLNTLAKQNGAIGRDDNTVRDFWTGQNAPDTDALQTLESRIAQLARCSGTTDPNGPPPYTTCTPPTGSTGFTADDWTTVVNQVLEEIESAITVDHFFSTVSTLGTRLFINQGSELDTIAADLGLQAAENNNQVTVAPGEIAAAVLAIAGSLADEVPGAGPALEVASELTGLMTSGSETFNSEFNTTLAGLRDRFTTMLEEAQKTLLVQSVDVRQSYGLLSLVNQLRATGGPWDKPDINGLTSANNQGFASWVYSQLLPSIYARYHVTGCDKGDPSGQRQHCFVSHPNASFFVKSLSDGQPLDFDVIGPPPSNSWGGQPCRVSHPIIGPSEYGCEYSGMDDGVANKVWGQPAQKCVYNGTAATIWTFACNVGVNPERSITLAEGPTYGWDFTNYCGQPAVAPGGGFQCADGSASVGKGTQVSVSGSATVPASFQVTSASLVHDGLLNEPLGRGELVSHNDGAAVGSVALTPGSSPGEFVSPGAPGARFATLQVGADAGGQRTVTLTLQNVTVGTPAACQQLPASDTLATPQFELDTQVSLSDGQSSRTVSIPGVWRCIRNAAEVVSGLQTVPSKALVQTPGLDVSLAGPHAVTAGQKVTYRIRVRNTRNSTDRASSSLWHVFVQANLGTNPHGAGPLQSSTTELQELRAGKSKSVRFHAQIPSGVSGSVCVAALASADATVPASVEICPTIAGRKHK
jgi:hypothetical protein